MERMKSGGGKRAVRKKMTIDHRIGVDRRKAYKIGYFMDGGLERRKQSDRRSRTSPVR